MHSRYLSGEYQANNPDWDRDHTPWKLSCFVPILNSLIGKAGVVRVVDIGCGSGQLLACMAEAYPSIDFIGYDPSSGLDDAWQILPGLPNLRLINSEFDIRQSADLIILSDVLEHLWDPIGFVSLVSKNAKYLACLIPIEHSVSSLIFPKALRQSYELVGHIHFFSLESVKILFDEAGCYILSITYTGRSRQAPSKNIRQRCGSLVRSISRYFIGEHYASVLLGGESVLILSQSN
ncbi:MULTISPECIES: class I SAM-dependent methyltransferase [Aphanothece]|uniref:class I SAM-dependent methyltransferase n=1 Tax=Aphanothece TaxID=1121 RepID=UPI0039855C22